MSDNQESEIMPECGTEPHHDARKENVPAEFPERDSMSSSAKRRERIRQLEARLERERRRETAASRKERNGQLFIWGAMVEGIYRDGNAQERDVLRRWTKRKLTEKSHLKRAENGFARIENEEAEKADA